MKQSMSEAMSLLKWSFFAIFGLSFLRVLLGVAGVPIGLGGKLTSTTVALLVLIVSFGVLHAKRRHGVLDLLLSVAVCVLVYNAAIAIFLSGSHALGLSSSYYLHPSHIGPDPDIPRHILAHLGTIPFGLIVGSVLIALAFGITKLFMYLGNRTSASTG